MKYKSEGCKYFHRNKVFRMFFLLVLIICCIGNLLCGEEVTKEETRFRQDLWTITETRDGLNTNYDIVYKKANSLLEKYYDNPAAKGRIYLEVLKVHALSGLTRPHEAIEYAKKAEQFPLSPEDKAQLYLSWGDSIQFTTPGAKGEQLRKTRRQAATQYLKSMKVLPDNNISINSEAPKLPLPLWELNMSETGIIEIPDNAPQEVKEQLLKSKAALEDRRKKREEYFKAKDLWEQQKEVIDRCVYSRDLTVKLYTLMPYDTPELKQLAKQILGDTEMVDDLVKRVDGRIKEVMDKWIEPVLEELPFGDDSQPVPVKDNPEPGIVPAKTVSTPNEMAQPRLVEEAEENRIKDDEIEEQPSAAVQQVSDSSSSYSSWIAVSVILAVIALILYRIRKGIL